jgi:hypothetical protein
MATGAMRVGGANPSENISNLVKMLNTTSGAKINTRKVNLKMDIVTGAAFAPDSRRIKQTEDIIKNINMFNQLRGAVVTAFFGDTLSASMALSNSLCSVFGVIISIPLLSTTPYFLIMSQSF